MLLVLLEPLLLRLDVFEDKGLGVILVKSRQKLVRPARDRV